MRPTNRPDEPYTVGEILSKCKNHFVNNHNPRCVNEVGSCVYTGTGCAVGFMFTEADSKVVTGSVYGLVVNYKEIYKAYFGTSNEVYKVLEALQMLHDKYISFKEPTKVLTNFSEHMSAGISAIERVLSEGTIPLS